MREKRMQISVGYICDRYFYVERVYVTIKKMKLRRLFPLIMNRVNHGWKNLPTIP